MANRNTNRRTLYSWMTRDGKGVLPGEKKFMEEPTVKNFFKLIGRNFSKMFSLNFVILISNFPLVFFFIYMGRFFSLESTAPAYTIFPLINGALTHAQSAFTSALIGNYMVQSTIYISSVTDYIFLGLSALTLFTFGPSMVGASYITRNMLRQENVAVFSDFWYSIKRNAKQAILFGIADVIILGVLIYDIIFLNINFSLSMIMSIMFFITLFIAVMYIMMRTYIYLMMLTFDLSIGKILKNALIFTVLGVKRNAMVLIGEIITVVLNVLLLFYYLPLGLLFPMLFILAFIHTMSVYGHYPIIDAHMIAPYVEEEKSKEEYPEEITDGNQDE